MDTWNSHNTGQQLYFDQKVFPHQKMLKKYGTQNMQEYFFPEDNFCGGWIFLEKKKKKLR